METFEWPITNSSDSIQEKIEKLRANMDRIKELTGSIAEVPVSSLIKSRTMDRIELVLPRGKAEVEKYNTAFFTSLLCTLYPDTVYPMHKHIENEYLIVIEGSIYLDLGDGPILYNKLAYIYIAPEQLHSIYVEEKSVILTITVPVSEEY